MRHTHKDNKIILLCPLQEAYARNIGTPPLVFKLGPSRRWVASIKPQSLFPSERKTRYQLHGWFSGTQIKFGHFGEEKNLLPVHRFEPRIIQPIP